MTTPDPQTVLDARKTARTLEPLHAFIYFSPGAARRYADLGITHGHMQYFASRGAAMGAVGAGPVVGTFFNFNPAVVERSLPAAWSIASPDLVLEARHAAAQETYEQLFDDPAVVAEALDLLAPAVEVVRRRLEGRALAAAYADLPEPTEPLALLWWRLTLLREWRGDGHVAALTAAGYDPVEALLAHIGTREVNGDVLKLTRAWPEERWDATRADLVARGELAEDGSLTEAGRARRQAVEDTTDALDAAAWAPVGTAGCTRLRELLRPYAKGVLAASGLAAMLKA